MPPLSVQSSVDETGRNILFWIHLTCNVICLNIVFLRNVSSRSTGFFNSRDKTKFSFQLEFRRFPGWPDAAFVVLSAFCLSSLHSGFRDRIGIIRLFSLQIIKPSPNLGQEQPEASLIVQCFTIYVSGSSCNYLFFLSHSYSFAFSCNIFNDIPKAWRDAKKKIQTKNKREVRIA